MVDDTIAPLKPDCALALGLNPSPSGEYRVSRAINQQGLLILTRVVRRDDRGLFRCVLWHACVCMFGRLILPDS
jgi:hypothetical protein